MKKIVLIALAVSSFNLAMSQTVEDSVKMVVSKLFTAMKSSNRKMLLDCFADSALLQSVAENKDGKMFVKNEDINDFAKQISTFPKGAADERITFSMIKIDGDLASVWTPYQFYFNNKFNHCGADSFQLVRINGEWKIQYLIDTRRKENCNQ